MADRPLLVLEQFAIYARERIVIVGDNGCGKTTLLRFLHERLKQRDDLKVGYMPQHYLEGVAPNGTVLDMLCHKQEKEVMQRARDLLGSLQFTAEEMEHAVASLSDGQKAKLHLASLYWQTVMCCCWMSRLVICRRSLSRSYIGCYRIITAASSASVMTAI